MKIRISSKIFEMLKPVRHWDPASGPLERLRSAEHLRSILSEETVAKALEAHDVAEDRRLAMAAPPTGEPLSLASALLHDRPTIDVLEGQVARVWNQLSASDKTSLARKLSNGTRGLLHTMSELGLGIAFQDDGWAVRFEVRFTRHPLLTIV